MKRKTAITVTIAAIVLSASAAVAAYDYYRTFYANNVSDSRESDILKIYRSYSYEQMLDSLKSSGILTDFRRFERAAGHMDLETSFKPGYYVFDPVMSNKDIVRMIANCWQKPVKVTIKGYIRSMEKFASILGTKFEADSASFAGVLTDRAVMQSYGFEEESFIGMFIPNTYEFYWTASPEEFVERMNREYMSFWTDERKAKAKAAGMTQKEVSTLAAIVISETKYVPEMPTIAGVYINRLKKGIPLQADPTVLFALNQKGIRRVLNKHLKVESPYNTYINRGLPPGPITMPSIESLDAVLNYQEHNYLYFCARGSFDGRHNFASTLSGHMANARAYHRALNAREKERALANRK